MTRFLLLHGNWHEGSAWAGVSQRLEQLGHIAHAPTLPRDGPDVATGVGYQEAGEAVADHILESGLRVIVLVGHSGGGVAISKAAELIADRVQRLVTPTPQLRDRRSHGWYPSSSHTWPDQCSSRASPP